MAYWEYTLTGFNDFLDQRRLAFTEPMAASRVCSICGRVAPSTVLLPCSHALCEECQGEVFDKMKCPFDGRAFTEAQLISLSFELSELEQLGVVCNVGGRKCTSFAGKLSELRDHMSHCRSVDVVCTKCCQSVARETAVDHYRRCRDANSTSVSAFDGPVQKALEEIRGIKGDLESLRERSLDASNCDDQVVNSANGLVERLASLERALSVAREMAGSGDRESLSSPLLRKRPQIPGPFRAASRPGQFIGTCKFADIYAARELLNQNRKTHRVAASKTVLGGYTFGLSCEFTLSGSEDNAEVEVSFLFYLHDGVWNDYLEWPFSKKVTLTVSHPTDDSKDVRFAVCMEGHTATKKPSPNESNSAFPTDKMSWKDIEFQGFIVKSALYINVEFE